MITWVNRHNKIRNETVRGIIGVRVEAGKVGAGGERRRGLVGNRVLQMKLPGVRTRGRFNKSWMGNIKEDMKVAGAQRG